MKSKTIILSSQNTQSIQSARAILTLFHDDELLHCRLRLYGIEKLSKDCRIGVYHNNQVFSANLLAKNGTYESSLVGDFDINTDFYVAIIEQPENTVLLAGGTYAGFYFNDNSIFYNEQALDEEKNEDIKSTETTIIEEKECSNCEHCKYKDFFYKHQQEELTDIKKEENFKPNEEKIEKNTIISSLLPQFQYIFENYSQNEELNSLLPNSKFVNISENGEDYSIGAMYQDDEIKYICYAVKCDYNTPAPEELGEHYQWLPLDKKDPLSEGFYIVFQDAKDLKIINL